MFDSGLHCITGLLLAAAILSCLVRKLSQASQPASSSRPDKPIESQAGIVVLLLSLMLVVNVGSIIGVILWETIQGIAGTVTTSPEVFVAASVGAAASTIGFALFALALNLLGPILSVVYEEWAAYIAPVIGGTVGAAISGGLDIIYTVPLSALTGAIILLLYEILTKKSIPFQAITELVIAGVGFGAINGAILALIFKTLEVTVGAGWLLAS